MLFTDESKFCLDFHDGRRRVWHQRNEQFTDCCIAEHDKFGGGSVIVWAGISYDRRTGLHVVLNGTVNAQRYIDDVLGPYVILYAGAIGEEFVLMDDNATAHLARIVIQYLEDQGVERMYWPSRSPDINPIEHAWDVLQLHVCAWQHKPATRNELAAARIEEWGLIPQRDMKKLIRSFQTRVREVIHAYGGHARFRLWTIFRFSNKI